MKRFWKRIHNGNKGFTLVELLIVIAIMGVLAGVVVPNVTGFIGSGSEQAAKAELRTIQTAMDAAIIDLGFTAATDGSAFTITDFSSAGGGDIDPDVTGAAYLYPDYLRTNNTSAVKADGTTAATYSWDTTGKVTSTAIDADGNWQ